MAASDPSQPTADHAGSTAFVQSKLHVPRTPRHALPRSRLTRLLEGDGRLVLLSAPAGFGKSTLLTQWTRDSDHPVAWVTLDHDDTDPIRFWTHLSGALALAVPGAFATEPADYPLPAVDEFVCVAVNGMCELGAPVILVLDDYHAVRSPQVDRSVERFIGSMPAWTKVVISTRRDPDLTLARLRATEQLIEIRQRDLRFTEEEATEWFSRRAIAATAEIVRDSLTVTEGWPAAYTLMFGSDRHRRGLSAQPDLQHIAAYIREEVVRHHDDDWPLLVLAAFCSEVCAGLVEHALDMAGGQDALLRLERSDVLFERVDDAGEWFRLHQLVADHVLVGRESDPDVQRWMVRAAEWFTSNNRIRIGLDILIRAGDHATACDMINRSWLAQLRAGQLTTLRNDLARIAPEVATRSPAFLVTRAWLHAHDGRRHDAVSDLQRAESLAEAGPLPDGCPSVEASRAVLNSLYGVEGLATVAASARQVDSLIGETSPWRPIADLGIGYASFMTGDLRTAQMAFDRVLSSSDVLLRVTAIGWSTVIDVLLGRTEEAQARYEEGQAMWRGNTALAGSPAVVVAKAALACAQGRPIEAAADLEECRARLGAADPTDRLELLVWLAGAEAGIGRAKRARQCVLSAERLLERLGGSAWHSGRLREIEQRIGRGPEHNGRDPGLTDREERILQLLSATHLSQREIGRELGISFNTIKSHVKSIYVKLGATSREEASQIARNNGLI